MDGGGLVNDDEPVLSPTPMDVGALCAMIAEQASVSYNWAWRHVPNADEPPRTVKMSGSSLVEFPMGLHELAYILPNAKFQSTGAGWEHALSKPVFSVGRTVQSVFQHDLETINIPPHRTTVSPDGNCSLKFNPFTILNSPANGGTLHQHTAFAYAKNLTWRFSWAATERNRRTTNFVPKRNSINQGNLDVVELDVPTSANFAPHQIILTDLKYQTLRTMKLDNELASVAQHEFTNGIFATKSIELPAGADGWDNSEVYTILKDRLSKWTTTMRLVDADAIGNFRTSGRRQKVVAWDERQDVTRYQPAQEDDADKGEADDADEGEADDATTTSDVTRHTFLRAVNPNQRTTSMLLRCTIELSKRVHNDQTDDVDRFSKGMVNAFSMLVYFVPDSNTNKGMRTPLVQRLRVLLGQRRMRSLLNRMADNGTNKEKLNEFVLKCASARLLHFLIEGIAIFKLVRDDVTIQTHLKEHFPVLSTSFYTQTNTVDDLYRNLISALERFPKFLVALRQMDKQKALDPVWIKHGGTPPPVTVSISVTASPHGRYATSIPGATPMSMAAFTAAVGAATCRLLYDPAPRANELFF